MSSKLVIRDGYSVLDVDEAELEGKMLIEVEDVSYGKHKLIVIRFTVGDIEFRIHLTDKEALKLTSLIQQTVKGVSEE